MIARVKKEELERMPHEMALAVKLASREQDGFLYLEQHTAMAIKAQYRPELTAKDNRKWRGMGDVVHSIAGPIGRILGLSCFDKKGVLKEASPCGKRRAGLNKALPFNP